MAPPLERARDGATRYGENNDTFELTVGITYTLEFTAGAEGDRAALVFKQIKAPCRFTTAVANHDRTPSSRPPLGRATEAAGEIRMSEFSTFRATYRTVRDMATHSDPESVSATHDASAPTPAPESDLLAEILRAEADFERGDYIDLTPEQLARCIETGELPWSDESPA